MSSRVRFISRIAALVLLAPMAALGLSAGGASAAITHQRRPVASGLTWSAPATVDPPRSALFSSITCPAVGDCLATQANTVLTESDGHWNAPVRILPASAGINSISCATATFCAAGGSKSHGTGETALALIYNGSTWSKPTPMGANDDVQAVSCPELNFCVAMTGENQAYTYNGTTWTGPVDLNPNGSEPRDVSCPTITFCVAVGDTVDEYRAGTWSSGTIPGQGNAVFLRVSCTSSSFCLAVGTGGRYSVFNGSAWTKAAATDSRKVLTSVSCTAASACTAVDQSGRALTYSGGIWSSPTAVGAHVVRWAAVSCPAAASCTAVGNLGYTAEESQLQGTTWTAPAEVNHATGGLTSVSCVMAAHCVAVDGTGNALVYSGSGWGKPRQMTLTSQGAGGVSCTSVTFCMAVGGTRTYEYNGTRWRMAGFGVAKQEFEGGRVSCASETFCVAAGSPYGFFIGRIMTWNGHTWTLLPQSDPSGFYRSLSCPTTTFCVAADSGGYVTMFNGSSWAATSVDSNGDLGAVSCLSSSFCAAVDYQTGAIITWDGHAWTSHPAPAGDSQGLATISCVSSSLCYAANGVGDIYMFAGGSWSLADGPGHRLELGASSCPSSQFCAVLDYNGKAVTGT